MVPVRMSEEVKYRSRGADSLPSVKGSGRSVLRFQGEISSTLVRCVAVLGIIGFLGLIGRVVVSRSTKRSVTPVTGVSVGGSQWQYAERVDATGRKEFLARTVSTNELSFDFPYQHPQRGVLFLRKVDRRGTAVGLSIERGRFFCGIRNCFVNVQFDNGPVQRFLAYEPDDHSRTTLLINGAGFIPQLRRARTATVVAFSAGEVRALQFNVDGLRWLH